MKKEILRGGTPPPHTTGTGAQLPRRLRGRDTRADTRNFGSCTATFLFPKSTANSYQIRRAMTYVRKDEFLSWGCCRKEFRQKYTVISPLVELGNSQQVLHSRRRYWHSVEPRCRLANEDENIVRW